MKDSALKSFTLSFQNITQGMRNELLIKKCIWLNVSLYLLILMFFYQIFKEIFEMKSFEFKEKNEKFFAQNIELTIRIVKL